MPKGTSNGADKGAVLADYAAGVLTIKEIIAKHGCAAATVNAWAKSAGLRRHKPREPKPVRGPAFAIRGGHWEPHNGIQVWVMDEPGSLLG